MAELPFQDVSRKVSEASVKLPFDSVPPTTLTLPFPRATSAEIGGSEAAQPPRKLICHLALLELRANSFAEPRFLSPSAAALMILTASPIDSGSLKGSTAVDSQACPSLIRIHGLVAGACPL